MMSQNLQVPVRQILLILTVLAFFIFIALSLFLRSSAPTFEVMPYQVTPHVDDVTQLGVDAQPQQASPILTQDQQETEQTEQTQRITRYDRADIAINDLHIITAFFMPQDVSREISEQWITNAHTTNQALKEFYEREFENKISVSYQVIAEPVQGDNPAAAYNARLLTLETKEKTKQFVPQNGHTIWMIYIVRDEAHTKDAAAGIAGGIPDQFAATQYEFWLDDEALAGPDYYGLVGSAHEFGHALGLPHPWELAANTTADPNYGNVSGDVMAYVNNSLSLMDLYIRPDMKAQMGLRQE